MAKKRKTAKRSTKAAEKRAGSAKRAASAKSRVKSTRKRPTSAASAARPSQSSKKKSAKRKSATVARTRARTRALEPAPRGCLDQEVATEVVFSCTGVGAVDPSVRLGQLFPGPTQRQGFCGCVFTRAKAAGSDIAAGAIPCGVSTKIADVIDSISC
jgi:hypothetical protein